MNFRLQVRESLANLVTSKLRSALTLLGVLVGTASVVALLTSGELATSHALEQFKTLGTDLLAVSIDTSEGGGQNNTAKLSLYDVETINDSSTSIVSAAPYTTDFLPISYQGNKLQGNIIGATQILANVIKVNVSEGRFLSFLDRDEHFCVIGNEIAKSLRQSGVFVPIGKQLRVGDAYFTIIGVVGPWQENMFMYADVNTSIIIPIDTALSLNKYATIQNIIFKLTPNADIDQVQAAITDAFNDALPGAKLFFRSAKQLIDSMKSQQRTFTLLLGAIGGISLIVGGIGVMNIMLVSVVERRREIGVRMAIGAKRRDIQNMFLTEAVVLTIFGGLMGVLLGTLTTFVIAFFSGWGFKVFFMPPIIGFVVSALVGIFCGIYPAIKASKLDPITTLRSD